MNHTTGQKGTRRGIYVHCLPPAMWLCLPLLWRFDAIFLGTNPWFFRALDKVFGLIAGRQVRTVNWLIPKVRLALKSALEDLPEVDSRSHKWALDLLTAAPSSAFEQHLAQFVGEEGARSYAIKSGGYHGEVAAVLTGLIHARRLCDHVSLASAPLVLDLPYEAKLEGLERYDLPVWPLFLWRLRIAVGIRWKMVLRGFRGAKPECEDGHVCELLSEVGDPAYADHRPGQANFLEADDAFTPDQICYYKSSKHQTIPKSGAGFAKFKRFVDLRRVPPSKAVSRLVRTLVDGKAIASYAEARMLENAAATMLDYGTLFETARARMHLTLPLSNDARAIRLDSGLITGLARRAGVRSVSYQTRPISLLDYELLGDSLDLMCFWSPYWMNLATSHSFIKQSEVIGMFGDVPSETEKENLVSVFPTEIADMTRNTLHYNSEFLRIAFELARGHPEFKFVVKLKFAHEETRFRQALGEIPLNLSFQAGNYSTVDLISKSRVVMAIGYTTPGIEALVRNVPTVIYSQLAQEASPLSAFPSCYTTPADAKRAFAAALLSRREEVSDEAAKLDPFRDGQARERLLQILHTTSRTGRPALAP